MAASIITILDLSRMVLQYVIDAKDAGDDRQRILCEISSVQGFLSVLKDKSDKRQSDESFTKTADLLNLPSGPLQQFKAALERLASKLRPAEGLKKFGKALSWPFEKQEIKDILSTMERLKSIFILALQNDHMYVFGYTC